MRTIALEEHFVTAELARYGASNSAIAPPETWREASRRLLDLTEERLPALEGPMWSWGVDTATHALRLIFGGVFDDFPRARLLLGHMGEGLPFALWRLDSRWGFHDHRGIELARGVPSEYLRHNLYITTSGVCSAPPLLCALLALGADHILFGTDYPFESMSVATAFLADAPISEADRAKISHENATALLRL